MQGLTKFAPGQGNVGLEEWPEPALGVDQVKVAVKATGICGTDLHIYHDEYPVEPPVILGHEWAGQVVETGKEVAQVKVGDRVTSHPFVGVCGHCIHCQQGVWGMCQGRRGLGVEANGAFAPYLVVPAHTVYCLPESLDYESAAVIEPLACCVKAVLETGHIRAGDVALIIGPGPIGLLASQLARAQGATTILLGTPADEERLRVGQRLGADWAMQVDSPVLFEVLEELTEGAGADLVVECAGAPAATRTGLQLLRRRGEYIQMGLHGRSFELDFELIASKDVRVLGSVDSSLASWQRALRLLGRGEVQLEPLVSHVLSLSEWEKGFELVRQKVGLKVILRPGD